MSFDEIKTALGVAYEEGLLIEDGHNASYIPELAAVNPSLYGIAACSIKGERWSIGDDTIHYTMQSTVKPFLYCLAQSLVGSDSVHEVSNGEGGEAREKERVCVCERERVCVCM